MASDSKTLLEDMGGDVDLGGRTLRFRTPHFSGYTIVWGGTPTPEDSASAPNYGA